MLGSRERRRSQPVFGRLGPALSGRRVAHQHVQQGPGHGDLRVALDQPLVLEPADPAAGRCRRVRRRRRPDPVGDQPGGPVGVPGGLGMIDRALGQPVGLIPCRRPDMQLGDQLGLASLELGLEQAAEQVVVAIPLLLLVQGDQQQVRPGQRRQPSAEPVRVQDRVAQRPTHAVQHRRPRQEPHHRLRLVGQHLGPQVVGQKPVIPRELGPGLLPRAACPSRLAGQRGKIQPHRPPLRQSDQHRRLGLAQLDPGPLQQGARLILVHPELLDPDRHDPAWCAHQRRRQPGGGPGGQRQLRPGGQAREHLGHGIQTRPVGERLQVVDDQGNRPGHGRYGGGQPGHDRARDRGAGCGQGTKERRVDRLDAIQRDGEVAQQDHRVVVALVNRHPSHAAARAAGPLGQQDRLAVAGRRHHPDDRSRRRGEQPLNQRGPRHDPRTGPRWAKLGLHQLQGRLPRNTGRAAHAGRHRLCCSQAPRNGNRRYVLLQRPELPLPHQGLT